MGGFAAEGEHEQPGRVDAPPGDPLDHGLDDGGRLPRARARQDQERAARVVRDGPLGVVEDRRARGRDRHPD
jgi:hypothetical protein